MIYTKLKNPRIKLSSWARMKEAWYPMYGYPNYAISTFGRVRSLDHFNLMKCGPSKDDRVRFFKGKLLKFAVDQDGYYTVSVNKDRQRTRPLRVHWLVYETFIGDRVKGLVINHIDFDRKNNRVINLEQVTVKENDHHSMRAGRKGSLSKEDVLFIRKEKSYNVLKKKYSMGHDMIWRIKTGEIYSWVGGKRTPYVWSKLKNKSLDK